jgi:hypothetical protein
LGISRRWRDIFSEKFWYLHTNLHGFVSLVIGKKKIIQHLLVAEAQFGIECEEKEKGTKICIVCRILGIEG